MLSAFMLIVCVLIVVMLIAIMLSIAMLIAIMLIVVLLSVVAPFLYVKCLTDQCFHIFATNSAKVYMTFSLLIYTVS